MPEPVKTLVLRAVKEAIESLDVIGEVVRNPSTPPQRETANYPVVFVFDETESKTRRNRYAVNVLPLHIEVWFRADTEDASDRADLIDSEIYKALCNTQAIFNLVMRIEPDVAFSADKQYVDEFLGVLVLRWIVTYGHLWGDPTDPQKP